MRKIILFTIMICLFTSMAFALTGTLGNARAVIYPEVPEGMEVTIERSILVTNRNDIDVRIQLLPDERMSMISEIIDNEFILMPGESKNARYKVTLRSGGDYGDLLMGVSFNPADPNVREPPVGLSATLRIIASGPINEWYHEVMNASSSAAEDDNITNDDEDEQSIDEIISQDNNGDEVEQIITTNVTTQTNDRKTRDSNPVTLMLIIVGILVLVSLILVLIGLVKKLK
ncbi:MAG: hypothetical protein ACMXYG_00015 [Candidatus Woesearchaeota archaeon]